MSGWRDFEHPYVRDIIDALRGHPRGRRRPDVIAQVWKARNPTVLSMPKAFEETVQNAYQRHADGYASFMKERKLGERPIFFSPGGKRSGYWGVDEAVAAEWLIEKIPPIPDPTD